MRILRFPRQRAERSLLPSNWITLAADRYVAMETDDEFRLYDLDAPDTPILIVAEAAGHALSPDCLIVQDSAGVLRRFERRDNLWEFVSRLPTPEVPEATSRDWHRLILSPSGRYLLIESAPISREPYWAVSRAFLT
jgi:hypothetical protein